MRRRFLVSRAIAAVLIVSVALAMLVWLEGGSDALKRPFHAVDERWLDERLMDSLARLTLDEDWSRARILRRSQDYAWLDAAPVFVPIAHALGESTGPAPNTIAALQRSYLDGFRVFEVDLSLIDGELHCQHDPDHIAPLLPGDCRFEALIAALPRDAWLVLDIKTDFASTGRRVVDALLTDGHASQVIFQLYRPEDFAQFDQWQSEVALPGPIVTAYLAHRSIHAVADASLRSGIRALTLPMWRLPALRNHPAPAGLAIFVHPVHDCDAWDQARAAGVRGIYTLRGLRCADPIRSVTITRRVND